MEVNIVKSKSKNVDVNERITAEEVRVIDSDGEQIGIMPIGKALAIADSSGLDLVEIAPKAKPSVCRVMDYGKYKYEIAKKVNKEKKRQNISQIKEIKVRPKTDEHDLQVKLGNIKKFIEKKDKVKVTLLFRGRELAIADMGKEILQKIAEETKDIAVVEQMPRFEGRIMVMMLAPK